MAVFTQQTDKNVALAKLNEVVAKGAQLATAGLEAMASEFQMRKDWYVKPAAMEFDVKEGKVRPIFDGTRTGEGATTYDLTPFALGQLYERASLPTRFADKLLDLEMHDLLRTNLSQLLHRTNERMLVRTVQPKGTERPLIKGVLSDAYKVMDSFGHFETYMEASLANGLVPYRGEVSDTRAYLAFLRPEVVEIAPGDFGVLGTELRNSDYGNGALEDQLFLLRLRCLNGLLGMDMFRKVHIGRRFEGGDAKVIEYSKRTLALDDAALKSGLRDTVKATGEYMAQFTATVKEKAGKSIDEAKALGLLTKKGLTKAVVEKVKTIYESDLPVEAVPQEKNAWRFANAIALLANSAKGDEHRVLQEAALDALLAA